MRIKGEEELMDLGIKGLELPEYVIKAALFDNKEIQSASHDVLSRWLMRQSNQEEAYTNFHAGLRKCGMNRLAAEVRQWVERSNLDEGECMLNCKK